MGEAADNDVAVGGLATPVGELAVAVTRAGLVAVHWSTPERLAARQAHWVVKDPARVDPVITQLEEYFKGDRRAFDLAIDWGGMAGARRNVLETLYDSVAYGESVTYGELAARSGDGVPARGIGTIMGSNRIPIVVPCHRVLAHDGLGGYSGGGNRNGLEVKRWLLTLEGVLQPTLDWVMP